MTVAVSGLAGVLLAVALETGGVRVAVDATVAAWLGVAVLAAVVIAWGFAVPPAVTVAVTALTGVAELDAAELASGFEALVGVEDAVGVPLGEAELTASAPAQRADASRKMGRANLPSFARQPLPSIVTPSEAA
ncbi:MAG TPA: hypothetical protein VK457_10255 [Chloroflexota bacterium]|nr:hypothetical protein [Chloroflexota bacterium]